MKIALCFRFAQTFLTTSLVEGQFLQITEKVQRFKRNKDTQRVLFHYRDKFHPDLVQGASPPKPPKVIL